MQQGVRAGPCARRAVDRRRWGAPRREEEPSGEERRERERVERRDVARERVGFCALERAQRHLVDELDLRVGLDGRERVAQERNEDREDCARERWRRGVRGRAREQEDEVGGRRGTHGGFATGSRKPPSRQVRRRDGTVAPPRTRGTPSRAISARAREGRQAGRERERGRERGREGGREEGREAESGGGMEGGARKGERKERRERGRSGP